MKELARTMLIHLTNAGGHGDLFDAAKVLFSTNHEEIAKAFIYEAERMNEEAMLNESLCPECGSELINVCIPATKEDPEENYPECTECHDSYVRRAC